MTAAQNTVRGTNGIRRHRDAVGHCGILLYEIIYARLSSPIVRIE